MTVSLRKTSNAAIAADLLARLDDTYELVYVDYRDQLSDEQVNSLVSGDWEELWESTGESESDARWYSVCGIINELFADMVRDWEDADGDDAYYGDLKDSFLYTDEFDTVRFAIEERDRSDWLADLARHTPAALLRIEAIDEDHAFSFEPVEPAQALARAGLPATEHNLRVMAQMLPECSPEFSVLMGHWIVGADVSDLYKMPSEGQTPLDIVNPHLYLGNPFSGSGYISEEPFHGTVRVRREDLRTDKAAFGYSVQDIYGGLYTSQFEAAIVVPNPISLQKD